MARNKQNTPKQAELSRRGAAAMAHQTRGLSRVLTPDKTKYDRRSGKKVSYE